MTITIKNDTWNAEKITMIRLSKEEIIVFPSDEQAADAFVKYRYSNAKEAKKAYHRTISRWNCSNEWMI
jgi:hypothetical protein